MRHILQHIKVPSDQQSLHTSSHFRLLGKQMLSFSSHLPQARTHPTLPSKQTKLDWYQVTTSAKHRRMQKASFFPGVTLFLCFVQQNTFVHAHPTAVGLLIFSKKSPVEVGPVQNILDTAVPSCVYIAASNQLG